MSLKKSFAKDGRRCSVTFTVSREASHGASSVMLAGDFNNWSSTETEMKRRRDGSFSVRLPLEAGKEYQFRYIFNGDTWENDWDADRYVPAPFSNTDNSVVCCIPE